MSKFLYGAAVQGIQSFIFQTNELKDIVGASELVDRICTSLFSDRYGRTGTPVVMAAGNIKFLFDRKEDCERAVREFPRLVMLAAPGITISQAVVEVTDEQLADDFSSISDKLEQRLRSQRIRPARSLTLGVMGAERSRKTGLPATKLDKGEYLDEAASAKRSETLENHVNLRLAERALGIDGLRYTDLPLNIEDMTADNSWIAIIHADGNGLGQVVARLGKDQAALSTFSANLSNATEASVQEAFQATYQRRGGERIPFRPIVLGGDDMTMLCRADLAVRFVQHYLEAFERNTEDRGHPLTACAGIAFVKASYPFHYGYSLAETLCGEAKRVAKGIRKENAPSCLLFHKVQSSFVEQYEDILQNEKLLQDGSSLEFGPYFIEPQESYWTVDTLFQNAALLDGEEGNAVKTDIRQWLTLMHSNAAKAEQKRQRAQQLFADNKHQLSTFSQSTTPEKRDDKRYYPAADMLALHILLTQQTK